MTERQSGHKIKILHTDRGGEFISHEFRDYCDRLGIKRQLSAPYSPQQNGAVERKNRTLLEMARSLMKCGGLTNKFWAETVATTVQLINISPTHALLHKTPYEAWQGIKPSMKHLKVFGCIVYVLILAQKHQKLDEKSERCLSIGYCTNSKAYKLYNHLTKKVIISRDVIFNESARWNWQTSTDEKQIITLEDGPSNTSLSESSTDTNHLNPVDSSRYGSSCDKAQEAESILKTSIQITLHQESSGLSLTFILHVFLH